MTDHVEGAFQVGIHHDVIIRFLHHGQQSVPGNARVVDQDMRRSEVRLDAGNGFLHGCKVRNVAPVCYGFHTVHFPAFPAYILRGLCVAGVNHSDIRTHGCQFQGNGFADSPGAAGYNGCSSS